MNKTSQIAHQLWWTVGAVVILMLLAMGLIGRHVMQQQAQDDAMTAELGARLDTATRWMGLTETNAVRTQAIITSSEPVVEETFKDTIAATSAQISQLQKSLEAMDLRTVDREQMGKVGAARKTMLDLRAKARQLKAQGERDQAVALIAQSYNPATAAYLQTLKDFVQLQRDALHTWQKDQSQARRQTLQMVGVALLLIMGAMVVGAQMLIRHMQHSLAQAVSLAEQIAQGDLTASVQVARQDEFGALLRSLQAMGQSLAQVVQQVRNSASNIATASAEIAMGNQDLSMRTEQTSSDLQKTAASMEQFAGTVEHSASSAQEASRLAAGASDVARRGGEMVAHVVSTMEEINHSSRKISDIIGVIDGIAFQTNILALNAAVEAARAGEQGRGFAVVASEVRSLAGRSAQAAKEIKALIGASVDRVEAGSRLVQDAGTTMNDIVQAVQRVNDMIAQISTAATQANAGIAQVNHAVGSLDQMTQQNAALVEESAAAAQSLREQADHLARVLSVFNTSGQKSQAPRLAA
ncbi:MULTISPECIES: methyl-accepting chemotaxis protein [Giesbergeria]|uniref:Methyl-accepting chemotaxis protein n=1 Tax=Giesbergeria sinuosa TaxID=80883 RepID=A0ABV9QKM0_9BURK